MRTLLVLLILGLGTGWATGQEVLPPPKESVPQPAPSPPPIMVMPHQPTIPIGLGFYRRSAYEHWQYMSTTPDGRWRPRVLTTPVGPYWAYDGRYYPYYGSDPRWIGEPGSVPGR